MYVKKESKIHVCCIKQSRYTVQVSWVNTLLKLKLYMYNSGVHENFLFKSISNQKSKICCNKQSKYNVWVSWVNTLLKLKLYS